MKYFVNTFSQSVAVDDGLSFTHAPLSSSYV
jgi:hypothetical protein